jgi:hypothetical protein
VFNLIRRFVIGWLLLKLLRRFTGRAAGTRGRGAP